MFAKVISYNMQFKSAKPVKPVCGLSNCYVDARTGALIFYWNIDKFLKKRYI